MDSTVSRLRRRLRAALRNAGEPDDLPPATLTSLDEARALRDRHLAELGRARSQIAHEIEAERRTALDELSRRTVKLKHKVWGRYRAAESAIREAVVR